MRHLPLPIHGPFLIASNSLAQLEEKRQVLARALVDQEEQQQARQAERQKFNEEADRLHAECLGATNKKKEQAKRIKAAKEALNDAKVRSARQSRREWAGWCANTTVLHRNCSTSSSRLMRRLR